ncbi:MAG: helix-hairpin-helix domain-containing protein [Candidatus Levyibacteriota bacterium]
MDERIVPFLKEHALALLLGTAGFICLGYGLFTLSAHPQADNGVEFQSDQHTSPEKNSISPKAGKQITIDVEGAVQKPGVYTLPATSRIQDALITAGGLSANADRKKVSQTINLAAPLIDSAKLYIPAAGDQSVASGGSSDTSSGSSDNVLGTSTKMVNINTASESDLDALPGVGPVTAQKIIANRPYQNAQDMVSKKAVGASVFSKIKDQVSVY